MHGMKRVAIWFGLVVGIALAWLIAINLIDEPLKPEVRALLDSKPTVSPEAVQGFKFALALRVPADQDPKLRGDEIYKSIQEALARGQMARASTISAQDQALKIDESGNPCAEKLYCYKAIFEKEGEGVASYLKRNEWALNRFDLLMAYQGMGSDLPPSLALEGKPGLVIHEFASIKYVQLSSMLHEKRFDEVAKALRDINVFIKNSLQNGMAVLDASFLVETFRENREFFEVASRGYPELQTALGPEGSATFQLGVDFASLVRQASAVELKLLSQVLDQPMNLKTFEMANLSANLSEGDADSAAVGSNGWRERALEPIFSVFLKRNQTLNLMQAALARVVSPACLSSKDECRDEQETPAALSLGAFVNPIGKGFLKVFRPEGAPFLRLKERIEGLNQPVAP